MKKYLFVLFFVMLQAGTSAQQLVVVNVFNGTAKIKGKTTNLVFGAVIKVDDALEFYGDKCEVVCEVKNEGIFRISASYDPRKGIGKRTSFVTLLKEMLFPIKKFGVFSHRSSPVLTSFSDVEIFLDNSVHDSLPMLVLDTLTLRLAKIGFPNLSENSFFLSRDTTKTYRQLPFQMHGETGELLIRVDDLAALALEGKRDSASNYTLYFRDRSNGNGYPVARFVAKGIRFEKLRPALKTILQANTRNNCEETYCALHEMLDYLKAYYGWIDKGFLEKKLKDKGLIH